jgi:hypothetical protein
VGLSEWKVVDNSVFLKIFLRICVIFWAGGGAIPMCGRTVQVKRRFQ